MPSPQPCHGGRCLTARPYRLGYVIHLGPADSPIRSTRRSEALFRTPDSTRNIDACARAARTAQGTGWGKVRSGGSINHDRGTRSVPVGRRGGRCATRDRSIGRRTPSRASWLDTRNDCAPRWAGLPRCRARLPWQSSPSASSRPSLPTFRRVFPAFRRAASLNMRMTATPGPRQPK